MRVKFWGTRGSVPTPGRATERYGGNTSCVEVTIGEVRLILDAGTGIRDLGLAMADEGPSEAHLLFSHGHWDHIQGLPFFIPLFTPGYVLHIYAPERFRKRLEGGLYKQMTSDNFPVDFGDVAATIDFQTMPDEGLSFGGIEITAFELPHPGGCWGYRISAEGKSLFYAPDQEISPGEHDDIFAALVKHIQGVNLLIADGQYTRAEYPQRVGWGHSPVEETLRLAQTAGVGRLAVTHHDPMRDDSGLSELERVMRKAAGELPVFFARDRLAVQVS